MDVIGSMQGCRYCGRPLSPAGPGVPDVGPPQVLCPSCRASSSLDSLIGQGAFASGGIALKVPRAQAAPSEPDRPPAADRSAPPAPRPTPPDVVIDLTDRAVANAAQAAAALEEGTAAPTPATGRDQAVGPDVGLADEAEAPEPDDAGASTPDERAADPGADAGPDVTPDAPLPAAPRRPERNPRIRDLTRGSGRPRSTIRRAEPLAPAPRPSPTGSSPEPGAARPTGRPGTPAADPTGVAPLDAGLWSGRGRRRPTIIDLRDDTPSPVRPPAGPQWSGGQERDEVRALLDAAVDAGVLHDRRAPGCLSAIDHLVVAASGVWVVDSMGFSGRVRASGGRRLRSRTSLHVGGRDRTPLLDDITERVHAVRTALADSPAGRVPFRGALCFSDEDLGRGTEPFELAGVLVTSRRHLLAAVAGEGVIDAARRAALLHALAERLPPVG